MAAYLIECTLYHLYVHLHVRHSLFWLSHRLHHLVTPSVYSGISLIGNVNPCILCVVSRYLPLYYRHWSSNGLMTTKHTNSNVVRCISTHLTSFAVLVDVSSREQDVSKVALSGNWNIFQTMLLLILQGNEVYAFKLVSYIGCVVSLICLGLSLLILVSCG